MEEKLSLVNLPPTSLPVEDTYRLVYPFKRLDVRLQGKFVDVIEKLQPIKEEIENYSMCDSFDAIIYSLRFLHDQETVNFGKSTFVDCMSFCGSTCLFAAAFDFERLLGIEYHAKAFVTARKVRNGMYSCLGSSSRIEFVNGSFQDYFQFNADVVFMDCTQSCQDTMLDEGMLLHDVFFPLCQRLLSGSYVIVVTTLLELHTKTLESFGLSQWQCIAHKPVQLLNSNYSEGYKDQYPRHVWILKVSNYKREHK